MDKLDQTIGIEHRTLDIIDKVAVDKDNGLGFSQHPTSYSAFMSIAQHNKARQSFVSNNEI